MKVFAAIALLIATGVTAQGSAQGTTKQEEYCPADYIVRTCVEIRKADVRSATSFSHDNTKRIHKQADDTTRSPADHCAALQALAT